MCDAMINDTKYLKIFPFDLTPLLLWCTAHEGRDGVMLADCWFLLFSPFGLTGACVRTENAAWKLMTSDKKQICREKRRMRKEMQLIKNSYLKLRHKLRRKMKVSLVIWISLDGEGRRKKSYNNSFQLQQTNFLLSFLIRKSFPLQRWCKSLLNFIFPTFTFTLCISIVFPLDLIWSKRIFSFVFVMILLMMLLFCSARFGCCVDVWNRSCCRFGW